MNMGKELEEGRVKGWREIREGEGYSNQNDIYVCIMYVYCMHEVVIERM